VNIAGTTFNLLQFHLHAHSEHTVSGQTHPLELHMVNRSDAGAIAVLAVFIDEGAENEALAAFLDNMPANAGGAADPAATTIDASALLPPANERDMWRYTGSLTTPPCTEGLLFHVFETPIEASAAQIEQFTALYDDNARPVQPLGEREVLGHID
jgi:carbonic anhydrase